MTACREVESAPHEVQMPPLCEDKGHPQAWGETYTYTLAAISY